MSHHTSSFNSNNGNTKDKDDHVVSRYVIYVSDDPRDMDCDYHDDITHDDDEIVVAIKSNICRRALYTLDDTHRNSTGWNSQQPSYQVQPYVQPYKQYDIINLDDIIEIVLFPDRVYNFVGQNIYAPGSDSRCKCIRNTNPDMNANLTANVIVDNGTRVHLSADMPWVNINVNYTTYPNIVFVVEFNGFMQLYGTWTKNDRGYEVPGITVIDLYHCNVKLDTEMSVHSGYSNFL